MAAITPATSVVGRLIAAFHVRLQVETLVVPAGQKQGTPRPADDEPVALERFEDVLESVVRVGVIDEHRERGVGTHPLEPAGHAFETNGNGELSHRGSCRKLYAGIIQCGLPFCT